MIRYLNDIEFTKFSENKSFFYNHL
jgi:hypothetical protein